MSAATFSCASTSTTREPATAPEEAMTGGATDHRRVAPWTSRILHGRRRWAGCPERLLLPYLRGGEEPSRGAPVVVPDAVALGESLPPTANPPARNDNPMGEHLRSP